MSLRLNPIPRWMAVTVVACGLAVIAVAQDSSNQSLGDAARQARKEHAEAGHVAARQLVNEEEDGPDTTGLWRVRACAFAPCHELAITLPKDVKWTRAKPEPRPVLIPLAGEEQDAEKTIRLYVAESLGPMYGPVDAAKRMFLQSWFARPEYFGQGARIERDEHVPLDAAAGLISYFTIEAKVTRFRGMSVVAGANYGSYGFACVFREQDAAAAASICDAIVRSARNQVLEPGKRPVYPNYYGPTQYYPRTDDPPEDPPDNDDPK